MFKNQLQELAQRSCFNLPAYACIREGPDHAPRFKATVNFNGEIFESSIYCSTLRQAEHAAAEVALNTLSRRGPTPSLAARVLDETSVCKNLLQETAQRAGVSLPVYTTIRSGPGHLPLFTCMVEVAGLSFTGEGAKTKKQAEKNAAMAAWSALRLFANQGNNTLLLTETELSDEQDQLTVARALARANGNDGMHSHGVQLSQHSSKAHAQRSVTASPSRMRLTPNGRDFSSPNVPGVVGQYHSKSWVPVELNSEAVQSERLLHKQTHGCTGMSGLSFRPVSSHNGNSSSPYSSRYLCGLSREAIAASRAAAASASTATRVIPTQLGSVPLTSLRSKHEVPIPIDEHQRDEEEWLRGSVSKLIEETENQESMDLRQYSLNYSSRCLSGLSREAIAASRAAAASASNATRVIPTQLRSVPLTSLRNKHEVPIPSDEHQRDEEEWLRGSVSKLIQETESQESMDVHQSSASVASFNPMLWSRSFDKWWNQGNSHHSILGGHSMSTGASFAPPVRVRSVRAVCAAPPVTTPTPLHQSELEHSRRDIVLEEGATIQVFNQLRL
ncbi:hypothetical protein O6H91_Y238100 [Diphasiastrum complanatum]|nr:hypothetical protein O6H91_Y238100 [Diphasiastrum complanatum]KAJ7294717.1 hypothetical protein O6H91_Y238100 [Diphasiastrum complanatum]